MEHVRCAQCRNPIRARQASVRHDRADMSFHDDCWSELHQSVQSTYLVDIGAHGVDALLKPYQRAEMAAWLPQAAIDEAVEALSATLAQQLATDELLEPVAQVVEQPSADKPATLVDQEARATSRSEKAAAAVSSAKESRAAKKKKAPVA